VRLEELAGARIVWEATPRSAWEADRYHYSDGPLRADAAVLDEERRGRRCDDEMVGWGFFCVQVRDMRAGLALVRCAPPGHREAELVEQDLVRPEEFADAVEVTGGTLDRSGHFPLTPRIRNTLRTALDVQDEGGAAGEGEGR